MAPLVVNAKPGDPVWRTFLTASRWANAIGVGPASRVETWLDMKKPNWRQGMDSNDNLAADWGRRHEPIALRWFVQETGIVCTANEHLYITEKPPEAPYVLGATPDALGQGDSQNCGLEIKCPYHEFPERPLLHHIIQAYACGWVLGRNRWFLCYWAPHRQAIYEIVVDERAFNVIKPFLLEFVDYLNGDQQPPRFLSGERKERMTVIGSTFGALVTNFRR